MNRKKRVVKAACMLAVFALWTLSLCFVDVKPIGPRGSEVGFAALNSFVHGLTGVHMSLCVLTDWLSILPVCFVIGFAILGLYQWIKRKKLRLVDRSVLSLGGFYAAVMAVYLLFEVLVINCRPILIDGVLEPSYPSSTTVLVLCVMLTAGMQLKNRMVKGRIISFAISAFTVFMVTARLLSGVHWFTDIVGGVLLSFGLVMLYSAFCE